MKPAHSGISSNEREAYRNEIARCARAMAAGRGDEVAELVVGDALGAFVKEFLDGNTDKRLMKLRDQLDLLGDAFDDLEERIAAFARQVPLAAYDTGSTDGRRFLDWLSRDRSLTPEQRDFIVCQRSRYAVEQLAAENRVAHVRFQDLRTLTARLSPAWGVDPSLRIEANPIHVTATFETSVLLDDEADPPARVVFFAVGADIHTAVLERPAEDIVGLLQAAGPLRLSDLSERQEQENDWEELVEVCCDLAELGLAAFG